MAEINELARKRGILIANAAVASQNETLIDDPVTTEAIELNVIAPLIVDISGRDQHIAALEAQLAEARKALEPFAAASKRMDDAALRFNIRLPPDSRMPKTHFTHGDLRAARRALTK